MASIQDVNGSIASGFVATSRVGFDVPLVIGRTGSRSILRAGSGTSGMIIKSKVRHAVYNVIIVVSGGSYVYDLYLDTITITVPTTATVKSLIADFNVNGGAVLAVVSIDALTTGSGAVSALASTTMAYLTVYQNIVNISQLQYYYDTTDTEYIIVNNMLGGSGTHINNLFLWDSFGVLAANLATQIMQYDTGDWYAACLASTNSTEISVLTNYFTNQKRLFFAVTDTVGDLATNQGRVVYMVHSAAQKDKHPEASWMAKGLVPAPGASDWKFIKDLNGQTINSTSDLTALLAVRAANGNSYTLQNGLSYVNDSRVNQVGASNSAPVYIDQIMLQDWIILNASADLVELMASLVAQGRKLSYDNDGIQKVISTIARRIRTAGENGALAKIENEEQARASYDGKYRYSVTAPTRAQVEATAPGDIVTRILNNVTFWYIPSGSIQKIEFSGLELLTEPATA